MKILKNIVAVVLGIAVYYLSTFVIGICIGIIFLFADRTGWIATFIIVVSNTLSIFAGTWVCNLVARKDKHGKFAATAVLSIVLMLMNVLWLFFGYLSLGLNYYSLGYVAGIIAAIFCLVQTTRLNPLPILGFAKKEKTDTIYNGPELK